jgi:hypothetical protein
MTRLHLVTEDNRPQHKALSRKQRIKLAVVHHIKHYRFWWAGGVGVASFTSSFFLIHYVSHLHKIAEISLGACVEAVLSAHLEE